MTAITIQDEGDFLILSSVLEERVNVDYPFFRKLLTLNLGLPFVRYALHEGNLTLLGQIVKENSNERLDEAKKYLEIGSSHYQSLKAGTFKKIYNKNKSATETINSVMEILKTVTEDNDWHLISPTDDKKTTDSKLLVLKFDGNENILDNRTEVRVINGDLMISNELVTYSESEDIPEIVLNALSLWVMRINAKIVYTKAALTKKSVFLLIRIPAQGLTTFECSEAIHSLRCVSRELLSEAQTLLDQVIATSYIEETIHNH